MLCPLLDILIAFCFFPFASLCSGAEYLLQVVQGSIPPAYFLSDSTISTAEVAVHVLDYLYKRLDEVCLVQGGEVVAVFSMCFCVVFLCCCSLPNWCVDNIWTRWKNLRCCCKSLLEVYCHM